MTVTFAAVITDASQTLILKQIEFGDTRKSGTINLGWRASVLAPIVDQNGNPIPGARLVSVPEPRSILLVGVLFVLAALRVLYRGVGRLQHFSEPATQA